MIRYPRAAALCVLVAACVPGNVAACALEPGLRASVVRVIDSQTVTLDDGREVRLIGALGPTPDMPSTPADMSADWPPERQAHAALEALVAGRAVELRFQGRRSDRYGRALAQLFVGGDWVQKSLVGAGHARAYGLPGNVACLTELLSAERDARDARRGLWAFEGYAVRDAGDPKGLLRLAGRFALVEGRVVRVGRTAKTLYLNFGDDWRSDFTASIASAVLRESATAADALDALAGRRVRVRGWIERRNGPMIVLNTPDEIEVLGNVSSETTTPR